MSLDWKDVKKGSYSRHVCIAIDTDECDICHETKPVLVVDTSDGEYSSLYICEGCAVAEFASKRK